LRFSPDEATNFIYRTNIAQEFTGDEIPGRDHNYSFSEDAEMAFHIFDQKRPSTLKDTSPSSLAERDVSVFGFKVLPFAG
jgi:hypothetical protein